MGRLAVRAACWMLVVATAIPQVGAAQGGTLVNVEVFVADRHGAPLRGLQTTHFSVDVDGKPVQVVRAEGRALTGASTHRGTVLVLIDNRSIWPSDRNRMLHTLRPVLERALDVGYSVLLVAQDRTLAALGGVIADRGTLLAQLREAEAASAQGVDAVGRLRKAQAAIDASSSGVAATKIARQFAESVAADARAALVAHARAIETLATMPGRRILLHISGGLPLGEHLFMGAMRKPSPDPNWHEASRQFDLMPTVRELTAQADRHHVTVYGINVGDRGIGTGGTHAIPRPSVALSVLSEDSGGLNINHALGLADALARLENDLFHYYVLSFTAPHGADGRHHRLRVRIESSARMVVRHRQGFVVPTKR